jgi:hypothetical protein
MTEEWSLGQGFGQTKAQTRETDTEGQQIGETEYHGEAGPESRCSGPGWRQSQTPGSAKGRQGRRVGIKLSTNINGYGPAGTQSTQDISDEDTAKPPLGHSDATG